MKRLPKAGEVWVNGEGKKVPLTAYVGGSGPWTIQGIPEGRNHPDIFLESGSFFGNDEASPFDLVSIWTDWQAEYERAKGLLDRVFDGYAGTLAVLDDTGLVADLRDFLREPADPDPQDDLCQRADYESKLSREQ